jgi:hypothetical protein
MPEPVQLSLFPEHASLVRIRPERNEWRFYRLEILPDLFGTFSSPATGDGSARKAATASTRSLISGPRSTLSPPWPAANAAADITTGPGGSGARSIADRGACRRLAPRHGMA